MIALITYDVSTRQSEVKAAMIAKGYSDAWTANGQRYNLPNTTLWQKGPATASGALADLKAVVATLSGVTLERAMAVDVADGSWSGMPGMAR